MLCALSIWPKARGLLAMVIGNWLWLLLVTMVIAYGHLLFCCLWHMAICIGYWPLVIIGFNL